MKGVFRFECEEEADQKKFRDLQKRHSKGLNESSPQKEVRMII